MMKIYFTEEDKKEEFNKIELEGEDVILIGEYIEPVENEENTRRCRYRGRIVSRVRYGFFAVRRTGRNERKSYSPG